MINVRVVIVILSCVLINCGNKTDPVTEIFLANQSSDKFDLALFEIWVNNKLVLKDSVRNSYLSFDWNDSTINTPKSAFDFKVVVKGNGYMLERDTALVYHNNLKIFITFDFLPYYKRYRNPEIYKHFSGETTRIKEIADSLYENKLLNNASEYLNDTIPSRTNLRITIQ